MNPPTHAVNYFDRLTDGQFAGAPALALVATAKRFGLAVETLRKAVIARRNAEKEARK